MTILVTGGAGYIGSHFVRHLERKKIEFVIADNFSTGHKKFVKNKKFFELDLKDPEEIRVKAKFKELKDLMEKTFKIIKIASVNPEYKKKIFKACLKTSELSKDIKFVNVFLKFSS